MTDQSATSPDAYRTRQRLPFAMVPRSLVESDDADPFIIAVYAALSARSNKHDVTWPSYDLLVKESHQGRARLSKSLKWLETRGWITITRGADESGHRIVNVYTLHETQSSADELGPEFATSEPEFATQSSSGELELEPSEQEPENKNHLATRNVAWDFLTDPDGFNMPATTKKQQSEVGNLARELNAKIDHEGGMTDTLLDRAVAWPLHFPDATMTPYAYVKHFTQLGRPVLRRGKREVRHAANRAATRNAIAALKGGDE